MEEIRDRKVEPQTAPSSLHWMLYSCLALAVSAGLTPQAKADFITQYPLSDFTLTNSPPTCCALDSAMMVGSSIVLTGDSEGNFEPATTDLVTTATQAGLIQFDWSFSTLDPFPMDQNGGYLLNGAFVQLADANGESGIAQFHVNTGEIFGFQVFTTFNFGEPPILTISSPVPEPRTSVILVMGIVGILWRRLWFFWRGSGMKAGA
jgi:hypothetical protein